MSRKTHTFTVIAALAGMSIALSAGCAGSAAMRSGGAETASSSYVAQFARGDYAAAKTTALDVARNSTGIERDRANLVAGLSAAQLGHNAEASSLLSPLRAHPDREIAGRALAGLGLVARNQGEKAKAAGLMAEGAKKLTGDPAAKAYLAAGDTCAELGIKDQAMDHYRSAMRAVQTDPLRKTVEERLLGKRYTVQLGVFSNKSNADRKAGEVRSKAVALGLGAPRIEPGVLKGKLSYLVQVGDFASKQEARMASAKLGVDSVVAEVDFN